MICRDDAVVGHGQRWERPTVTDHTHELMPEQCCVSRPQEPLKHPDSTHTPSLVWRWRGTSSKTSEETPLRPFLLLFKTQKTDMLALKIVRKTTTIFTNIYKHKLILMLTFFQKARLNIINQDPFTCEAKWLKNSIFVMKKKQKFEHFFSRCKILFIWCERNALYGGNVLS